MQANLNLAGQSPKLEHIEFKLLFSVREAARVLAISPRKVGYLLAAGELKPTRIGRRCLLSRSELERYVRSLR